MSQEPGSPEAQAMLLSQRSEESLPEPWMRTTHGDLDPLRRAVVHALELTLEDVQRKVQLDTEQMQRRPAGLPSVAFHLRHIARSLDRLLTYAEDCGLTEGQLRALGTEHASVEDAAEVYAEFERGVHRAIGRVVAFQPASYPDPRGIGRRRLPTTVAGLLIHCAEHTQRHTGQAITTAALVRQESLAGGMA